MSIRIDCPTCGKAYQVAEQLAGKKMRCKSCGGAIFVPGAATAGDPGATHADADHTHGGSTSIINREPPPASEPDDSVFQGVGAEETPEPSEAAPSTPIAPSGLKALDTVIPIVIALCCLGWLTIRALENDEPAHGWIGPARAAIYLLVYAAIAFPIALRGVRVATRKLYLPTPSGSTWKMLGIFCAPMALGSVLILIADSPMMFIVGALLGLVISLGAFVFVFWLQPRQISRALTIVGLHLVIGTALGLGALYGINVLLMASLNVSHTASEYAQSPLGRAFPWNAAPADNESHKPRKKAPSAPENEVVENPGESTTNPATEPVAPTSKPQNIAVATTTPATLPSPTTHVAIATLPATQPQVVSPNNSESHAPAPELSPLLAHPPVKIIEDQPLNVFFPSVSGTQACLVLRNRTDFGDEVELWNGPNWAKTQSITLEPKTAADHGDLVLAPKSVAVARMINSAHLSLQSRPLTGDPASQEKLTRVVDLQTAQTTNAPYVLQFTSTGLVAVVWRGMPAYLGFVDTQSIAANPLRSRAVALTGLEDRIGNLVLTPDARYVVSVQHNPTIGNPPLQGNYVVVDAMFGSEGFERWAATDWPAERSVQLAGIACSADSKQVAVMYVENGNGLIEKYHLPDAARVKSHIFSGPAAQVIEGFRGSAITWIAGDTALLINGRYVMDAQTFDTIGDLGIDNVRGVYVLDRTTLALIISENRDASHCSVLLATLNGSKFPALPSTRPVASTGVGKPQH